jgi:hypothetical protein
MQFGNVANAMEYQERVKMAKWELIEVDNVTCDECQNPATCNIYRMNISCICLACRDLDRTDYIYLHVCGNCLAQKLKTREFDDGE